MIVYLAGPYRAKSIFGVARNIYRAWRTAKKLWRMGYVVLCPHANTAFMSEGSTAVPAEKFLRGDLELLFRADAVFMLPGWETSEGAIVEMHAATLRGIPVVYSVESLAEAKDLWKIRRC